MITISGDVQLDILCYGDTPDDEDNSITISRLTFFEKENVTITYSQVDELISALKQAKSEIEKAYGAE